jgi:hypothetical protein
MTRAALSVATLLLALGGGSATGQDAIPCIDCISVRVGPPQVVRGPFPDELDAAFSVVQLEDGRFRGFTANGVTFAVDSDSLWSFGGERNAVLQPGEPGSINECGRWLTSVVPADGALYGFVHQESICDYGPGGQTDKSMAIARSDDQGLTWVDLGTVITGSDAPAPGTTSGEGDCSMLDGGDGYLYAYCLRNTDWQTIAARAPVSQPTEWTKYFDGRWDEPGLDGEATAVGFVGTGAGYLADRDVMATVTTDPWFEGLRLSFAADKVTFVDLDEPLIPVDGSDWNRPAPTDLIAYGALLDPDEGSNRIGDTFILSYVYVPAGQGFESRYLVHHEVKLEPSATPVDQQVGLALTRWVAPDNATYASTTAPLTGAWAEYRQDHVVAYMLTKAPDGLASFRFAECDPTGPSAPMIADEASCGPQSEETKRTAGWLFAEQQPDTVPVYRCRSGAGSPFVSSSEDCEALGSKEFLLGYGWAP